MYWEIQKQPKIKKCKEYLKKLILSIAETMNDFYQIFFLSLLIKESNK